MYDNNLVKFNKPKNKTKMLLLLCMLKLNSYFKNGIFFMNDFHIL